LTDEGRRRPRAATVEKRDHILDATEEVLLRDGYAGVTSRSVAAAVGMRASLLHYHYPTIDDLLIAVVRRLAEQDSQSMRAALESAQPLLTWWKLAADPRGAALFVELLAAANHRPAVRSVVGEVAAEVRSAQISRLYELLPEYDIDPRDAPPALVAAAMHGLAFGIVQDAAAGYDTNPAEAGRNMVELLTRVEARRSPR
jgi:AcrR family transcriptional regulator